MEISTSLLSQVQSIAISDYDYPLPPEQIAQKPIFPREEAKLLVCSVSSHSDAHFGDLPDYLPEKSLLVFNNTRVLPARLRFRKPTGGHVEVFLLQPIAPVSYADALAECVRSDWEVLLGNAKRWRSGAIECLLPNGSTLYAERIDSSARGVHCVRFSWGGGVPFAEILDCAGRTPIPPYLNREDTPLDREWYQTVFAQRVGSVAAPTAGLHFSDEAIATLRECGHSAVYVTLHVGAGTFLPVKSETVGGHPMHSERICVERELVERLLAHLDRVIPVGTTSLRALESLYWLGVMLAEGVPADAPLHVSQWMPYGVRRLPSTAMALEEVLRYMDARGVESVDLQSSLLIAPGYKLRVAAGLITNFHQPQSTLLLLVAAIIGAEWRAVYHHALERGYRFLSYGDGMLIFP